MTHITIERAKLEQWLEALDLSQALLEKSNHHAKILDAYTAIEAALAQPAQEPTGMLHIDRLDKWLDASLKKRKAQRPWVDLTEDEMDKVRQSMGYNECMSAGEYAKLVQFVTQTKLKEKNNG